MTMYRLTMISIVLSACASPAAPPARPRPVAPPAPPPPALTGTVTYDDDRPAAGAGIAFTDVASGAQVALVFADRDGRFTAPIAPAEYAIAATAEHGALFVEKQALAGGAVIKLANDCERLTGHASPADGVQVSFLRLSPFTGDTFFVEPRPDGAYSLCLPRATYTASLTGQALSFSTSVTVPASGPVELRGHTATTIRSAPRITGTVAHDLDALVDDILRANPRIIGLGEATHGSAEFVTARATLTFELARRANVELVLLENDAIAGHALERYVNGDDIDLLKSIAALGFWTTDTFEFVRFIQDVRIYNLAAPDRARIHIWGIDVQNTELPVALLIANARALRLSADDQALLQSIAPGRAKAVKQFPHNRRATLDALLQRLSTPAGPAELDTRLAVAARSLAVQVGYMDVDQSAYGSRRDTGMAQLATFITDRTAARRAVVWAHDGHVSRSTDTGDGMGEKLAALPGTYYPVGFFLFPGSARAWDAAGKIGVISHPFPPAPPFTLEGALMAATGAPDIAWLPLHRLPPALRTWLALPRFARWIGAGFNGLDRATTLFDAPAAFDALVIIKTVHDSSPTATGVRRASK